MRRPGLAWLLAALVSLALAACDDMDTQPRYRVDEPSAYFADGRSTRPPVPGTVRRGAFDPAAEEGIPQPLTRATLERGRERFEIFCTPCHGHTGDGDGLIVRRGFPPPPSFHSERLRAAPDSHIYAVITQGIGAMYPYGSRVPPADRWAIAAYIRALQLSQHAPLDRLTEAERQEVEP